MGSIVVEIDGGPTVVCEDDEDGDVGFKEGIEVGGRIITVFEIIFVRSVEFDFVSVYFHTKKGICKEHEEH